MPEAVHGDHKCHLCHKVRQGQRDFWRLSGYFGIDGVVCATCFKKIEHTPDGSPKQPVEYLLCLLKTGA